MIRKSLFLFLLIFPFLFFCFASCEEEFTGSDSQSTANLALNTGAPCCAMCGATYTSTGTNTSIANAADFGIVLSNGCTVNINESGPKAPSGYLKNSYFIFNPGTATTVNIAVVGVHHDISIVNSSGTILATSATGTLSWTVDTNTEIKYIKVREPGPYNYTLSISGVGGSGPGGTGCGTTYPSLGGNNSIGTTIATAEDFGFVLGTGCSVFITQSAKHPSGYRHDHYFIVNTGTTSTVTISAPGTFGLAIVNASGQILASGTTTLTWTVDTATAPRYLKVTTESSYNITITITGS